MKTFNIDEKVYFVESAYTFCGIPAAWSIKRGSITALQISSDGNVTYYEVSGATNSVSADRCFLEIKEARDKASALAAGYKPYLDAARGTIK